MFWGLFFDSLEGIFKFGGLGYYWGLIVSGGGEVVDYLMSLQDLEREDRDAGWVCQQSGNIYKYFGFFQLLEFGGIFLGFGRDQGMILGLGRLVGRVGGGFFELFSFSEWLFRVCFFVVIVYGWGVVRFFLVGRCCGLVFVCFNLSYRVVRVDE